MAGTTAGRIAAVVAIVAIAATAGAISWTGCGRKEAPVEVASDPPAGSFSILWVDNAELLTDA